MADDYDLDDDERKLIDRHRASRRRDNRSIRIRDDKGNEAEGPLSELGSWVKRTFGLDPEEEPVQDEAGGQGEGGKVKRFQSGRRVS